ncbi:MAG: HAMP domain-containing protein [Planctomycetota bacterium]
MAEKKAIRRWVLPQNRLMIDSGLQRPILVRTFLYCGCCVVYFAIIFVFAQIVQHPDETWGDIRNRCFAEAIFWMPGLMLLAPLMAVDCLQTTRRFAGPLTRLQRHMESLASGQETTPLQFRDDDHFQEMAESFNLTRSELIRLKDELEGKSSEPEAEVEQKPLLEELPVEEPLDDAAGVLADDVIEDPIAIPDPAPAAIVPDGAPVRELV